MDALKISPRLSIPLSDIELTAIRSQGPGGQNVNKVASAIHLRFDVKGSQLSDAQKSRILSASDSRISRSGVIVVKAQNHRTQSRNREEALSRLAEILKAALKRKAYRIPTRPTKGSVTRRLKKKSIRSDKKALRGKIRNPRQD